MSGTGVEVFGGVDTHRDTHVAAVVDRVGRVLGCESFVADESGYGRMVAWFRTRGTLVRVGVEGTGSYGAGLARYMAAAGVDVVEVMRPNRQRRRARGKSDQIDAEAAAQAAASGQATAVPKSGVGPVECIRMLRVARRSATKARSQAANQIHSLVVTAPEPLKHQLKGMSLKAMVGVCSRSRPGDAQTTVAYAKKTLRHLARRYQALDAEITDLEADIRRLCAEANPALLAANGVGPDTASVLLTAAGDNPERMKTEKSFAALCGANPIQASSGQTIRHRVNRGGNRQANSALWRIAITRMRTDQTTQDYVARRTAEGKNKREIIRCLKRHIAREIHRLLTNPPPTPDCARLRTRRLHAQITLTHAAQQIGTHPSRISALETGRDHNHQLATRYQTWLQTHQPDPSPI